MAESQRAWNVVAEQLNHALASCRLSPVELAERAGINYFAARRFLHHGARNRTAGALRLCDFFAIPVNKPQQLQSRTEWLSRALRDAWDGSEAHAKLLAKLIGSTRPFKITDRE